jgi:hypothetical protein
MPFPTSRSTGPQKAEFPESKTKVHAVPAGLLPLLPHANHGPCFKNLPLTSHNSNSSTAPNPTVHTAAMVAQENSL